MKVGVLGTGDMGATVIGHLKKNERVKSIVAYDLRPERIREVKEKFAVVGTTNINDVLGDQEVQLVFVTASNNAHKDLTIRALNAGKAVMCEKPMATILADAREMVETAEKLDAFLQIGFELHYSKLYTKVKEWIEGGLLGDIVNSHCYYVASAWDKNEQWRCRNATGGSMFGEKLSHYVDLPRWWIGDEVVDVYTVCSPNIIPYYEVRDNYHTTYRFKKGAVSHLTFIMGPAGYWADDPLRDTQDIPQNGDGHHLRYTVVGTKGSAETDVFNRTIKRWEFRETAERFLSCCVEKIAFPSAEGHFYYHNTTDQTLDIVRRVAEGLPPKTSPQDSYETMKFCFAAEQSAKTGKIVSLRDFE
jgi:predicted dehydrogenase